MPDDDADQDGLASREVFARYEAALRDHPAAGAVTRWGQIGRARDIFVRNAAEVLALIAAIESDPERQLQLMRSDDSTFMREFVAQLDQRLHNFVAAILTLVEMTRRNLDFYRTRGDAGSCQAG